jgi:hypothetical protein
MSASKLPRRLSIVGIGLGFAFMGAYYFDYKYNPFHLPNAASVPPGFSAPALYHILEKLMFVACPGLFLQVFTIGSGDTMALIMWTVAVLMNGLIYYGLGWVLSSASARFRSLHTGH